MLVEQRHLMFLIYDGARNARLNEEALVAAGLMRSVVRGENTASSIDENLSTRPPTTQRTRSPKKISSCRNAPPSLRSSPPGAIEMSNVLCRKLPPNVSAWREPMARMSDASMSNVLVSKSSGRNGAVGVAARDSRFSAFPLRMFVTKACAARHADICREVRHVRRAVDVERPMPLWMILPCPPRAANVSIRRSRGRSRRVRRTWAVMAVSRRAGTACWTRLAACRWDAQRILVK